MNVSSGNNILEKFLSLTSDHPNDLLFTFVNDKGKETERLTRKELAEHAAKLGGHLTGKLNIKPGERVLLAYPQESLDFVKALMACLHVGIIPVPVAPPNPLQLESSLPIFRAIAEDCGAVAILTNKLYTRLRQLAQLKQLMRKTDRWTSLPWHRTDTRISSASAAPSKPYSDDVALLQYTSGSTAAPKGVMLSHGNLMHQLDYIQHKLSLGTANTSVTWVPHFHDFGLISCILNAIFGSGHLVMFSPIAFIRCPGLWGRLLSRYKATHTAAPDFAYLLATKKTTHAERASWDLSHMQVALCAAEPVRESTVNAFIEAHQVCKFDPAAFLPAYGLAEHTVGATMGGKAKLTLSRAALGGGRVVVSATQDDEQNVTLYGCGELDSKIDIAIVDPKQNIRLQAGKIGEIWLSSPSCGLGYWGKPEATAETFQAKISGESGDKQWLRTGDLGFVHDNELYVSGRIKDMIIANGRNIYPQDIEAYVPQVDQRVKPGRVAAFGVPAGSKKGEQSYGEAVVLLLECRDNEQTEAGLKTLILNVRQSLAEQLNVYCQTIIVLGQKTIEKTSSGKLKRQAMKARFQQDAFAKQTLAVQHFTLPVMPSQIESPLADEALKGDAAEIALWVRYKLAEYLGVSPDQIADDVPLSSYAIDSLTTFSLINDLSSWAGRPLPVSLAYQHFTLTQMAEMLFETQASFYDLFEPGEPIELPLSPQQHRFLAQQLSNLNHASLANLIEVPPAFDAANMQQAIDLLVAKYEMLRTRFSEEDGDWQQIIYPTAKIELGHVSTAEGQFNLEKQLEQLRGSLDIKNGPLVRIVHFDFGAGQPGRLLLLVHQFLADAESVSILSDQLIQQYERIQTGNTDASPKTQSATYATWMMRMLDYASSERMKKHADYWRKFSSQTFPSLSKEPSDGEQIGRSFVQRSIKFETSTTDCILAVRQQDKQITPQVILLNAISRACQQWMGESSLLIGLSNDSDARHNVFNDLETEQTIGWLEASYPFSAQIKLAESSRETAVQIAEQLYDLGKHGFSYEVLKFLCDDPALSESVANFPEPEITFSHSENIGNHLDHLNHLDGRYRAALNFSSSLVAGQLHMQIDYCEQSFSQTTIDVLEELLKGEIMAVSSYLLVAEAA